MKRDANMDLLELKIDSQPTKGAVTGLAGLLLVAQTFRVLGLARSVTSHVQVKERDRGFTEAEMVESLILLLAAGGEVRRSGQTPSGQRGRPRL